MEFITEPGYYELTPEKKAKICNGAGAAGDWRSAFIPNTIFGLDCTEVFNIHDYAYFLGVNLEDKYRADRAMLQNLLILIDNSCWPIFRWLRRLRAIDYYTAVVEFGNSAFFKGKRNEFK
jgi:hypothetical protein